MTTQMKCPTPVSSQVSTSNGNTYVPDAYGFIQAQVVDVIDLLRAGFTITPIRDNLAATVDPTTTDDTTKDYAIGSRWINTTNGSIWVCEDATASAAVWFSGQGALLGKLIGANMNATTDQPFVMSMGGTGKFRVTKITANNASTSLTTAVGGVYSAASKGGDAIVANSQVFSALTGATLAVDLTIATTPGKTLYAGTIIPTLSLTTAQGGAATADLYLYGDRYI